MRLGSLILLALLGCGMVAWGQQTVFRTRPTEQQERITVRAGILLVESSHWENPEFAYLMVLNDPRYGLKPAGWEFENPLAPEKITDQLDELWNPANNKPVLFPGYAIQDAHQDEQSCPHWVNNTIPAAQFYQNPLAATIHTRPEQLPRFYKPKGTPVTKDMPQYWEVPLTPSTASELSNFDILFLHTHRLVNLTAQELSWIQRFVDGGGTLWLENSHGSRIATQAALVDPKVGDKNPRLVNFFLPFQYRDSWPARPQGYGPNYGLNPTGFTPFPKYPVARDHPLLNQPFRLTDEEVNNLGDVPWADHLVVPPETLTFLQEIVRSGYVLTDDPLSNQPYNPPAIVAGAYGSGRVVICGVNVLDDVSQIIMRNPSWPDQVTSPHPSQVADVKFMYNVLYWAHEWSQARGNPRHHGRAVR